MFEAPILGQILIFLTTVIGFGIQMYRESRNRKWDLADRAAAREQMKAEMQTVKEETVVAHEIVVKKIEENTEISRTAFSEANNVNAKLLTLAEAINTTYDRKAAGIRERETDLVGALGNPETVTDVLKEIQQNTAATAENTDAIKDASQKAK